MFTKHVSHLQTFEYEKIKNNFKKINNKNLSF